MRSGVFFWYASRWVLSIVIGGDEIIDLIDSSPLFHLLYPLNNVGVVLPILRVLIQLCYLGFPKELRLQPSLFVQAQKSVHQDSENCDFARAQ